MQSLIPYNEPARLQALLACKILDTPAEACFDEIVARAAADYGVPISTFAFIDSERHWVKASVGPCSVEVERAISMCSTVVANN
ncbi:MAG: hypothetical protein HOM16_11580 [Woeseia sp.]|nr:hypothetical protein [Woeseia sp.]